MLEHTPAHDSLARLVGRWTGRGEVLPNPWGPGGPTTGEWRFHLDASRYNLIGDYTEDRAGHPFEAHAVMTVDPATGELLWFWFDSIGFPPLSPFRGNWQGDGQGGRLAFDKTTPRGQGRIVLTLDGAGMALHMAVSSRLSGAADFEAVMHGSFQKQDLTE